MRKIVASESKPIFLGRLGENEATVVEFDVADWEETFGTGGQFSVWAKRNGDSAFYPCQSEYSNGKVQWIIQSSDVAVPGFGLCGLIYRFGSDGNAKSVIYTTYVNEGVEESDAPPAAWESWVESVLQAAQRIDSAAEHYPYIASDTQHWMVWDSESDSFQDTGISAGGNVPQKGVDYFTDTEIEALTQSIAAEISVSASLSQLQSDTGHRTVSDSEKNSWNGKYTKPTGGIPASDMAAAVQTSLGKADSALQTAALSPYRTAAAQDEIDAEKYSADNPPPYPVISVNSCTGAVSVAEVPSGGTTNQVLTKTASGYGWQDPQGGSGTGDMLRATYDPTGKAEDIFAYADDAAETAAEGKYVKPSGGIPASDMAAAVQTSLGKADSALQVESDPTVPSWAKAAQKPTYTASEVGARPDTWTPSKSDVGLGNVDNVQQYSASNPPPYPVTSVNSRTGAVTVAEVPSGGTTDQVLTKTTSGYGWADKNIPYVTTAPTAAYTGGGLKVALLDSEPTTKYDGWLYLIKEVV